ncbi:MAG: hypothetical protein ABI402_20240 [Ferruginibacter sp.]
MDIREKFKAFTIHNSPFTTHLMTDQEKRSLKQILYKKAITLIEQRISTAAAAMQNAQAAANEEEKSSAGDKYETSRAMSHLEKDMYAKQSEENKKELAFLTTIDCNKLYDSAVAGCLINCDECSFFIAAGLGKIDVEGMTVYFLSPNAPLAKLLNKKKVGDAIEFNKKEIVIRAVY